MGEYEVPSPEMWSTDAAMPYETAMDTILGRIAECYWPKLASMAWRAYLAHGRGAVIVPWRAVMTAIRQQPLLTFPFHYTDVTVPGVQDVLQRYDPQTSIVVLVLGDDDYAAFLDMPKGQHHTLTGIYLSWIITQLPAPPKAHRSWSN